MTDTIADLLTRLRNATLVRKTTVVVPASKLKQRLAEMLQRLGYIEGVKVEKRQLVIELRYIQGIAAISSINRVSKPGRRVYSRGDRWPQVLGGKGVVIVSTTRGLMTATEAAKLNLGGEVIGSVW